MSIGEEVRDDLRALLDGLVLAAEGSGPLLQRDYWAVIRNPRMSAPAVADVLAREFCSFAPEELVRFNPEESGDGALEPGAELEVKIRMAGSCYVRVVHRNANSLTLATLKGHPEAGRITFGAYPNEDGELVFHIRSRARSSSGVRYAGYLAVGEPMQTTTWTDFITRLALRVGDGVEGAIHVETTEIEDEPADPTSVCAPTFLAVGG